MILYKLDADIQKFQHTVAYVTVQYSKLFIRGKLNSKSELVKKFRDKLVLSISFELCYKISC